MAKVFVSYSSIDQHIAERVHAALESLGHEAWMDRADLRGGDPWIDVIQDHIRWCEVMVVLWSEHAAASNWVRDELTFARSHNKHIIPMQLDNIEATRSMIINALQMIDARGERLEKAINQVDEVIRRGPQAWLPSQRGRLELLPWLVVVGLLAAVILVGAIVLPQISSPTPTPPPVVPSVPPVATDAPVEEVVNLNTLNNWRQQRDLPALTTNPILQQVATYHMNYLRSLPLLDLQQTNVYLDRAGNDPQAMVEAAGYTESAEMFVYISDDSEWTMTNLLNPIDRRSASDILMRYNEVGFAPFQAPGTQDWYYVLILGQGED